MPSRFPPVGLFDRVADSEDLESVFAVEALTNDRLRDQTGEITLVPPDERISGDGTTPIMAAFTHPNPSGSRFADGSRGIYYAARDIETAIEETKFHKERFFEATREPSIKLEMRSYASDVNNSFHDIRGMQSKLPEVYDPDPSHYPSAQSFARKLRDEGSNGIVYDSIRHIGGECVAVFRPRCLSPVRQGAHYCYVWDGREISFVYKMEAA